MTTTTMNPYRTNYHPRLLSKNLTALLWPPLMMLLGERLIKVMVLMTKLVVNMLRATMLRVTMLRVIMLRATMLRATMLMVILPEAIMMVTKLAVNTLMVGTIMKVLMVVITPMLLKATMKVMGTVTTTKNNHPIKIMMLVVTFPTKTTNKHLIKTP